MSVICNNEYDDLDRQFVPTSADRMDKHTFSLSYAQSFCRSSLRLRLRERLPFWSQSRAKEFYWKTGYTEVPRRHRITSAVSMRYTFSPLASLKVSYERVSVSLCPTSFSETG